MFRRAGHMRTSELTKSLEGYEVTKISDEMNNFHIEISTIRPIPPMEFRPAQNGTDNAASRPSTAECRSKPIANHEKTKPWGWVPPQARYHFLALTFILPILSIGALEALYEQSTKRQGLADTKNNIPSHYVQYFSTLVLFAITSAFDSIDFSIMTFALFSALRSNSNHRSVSKYSPFQLKLIGHIPPLSLYKVVRGRQYGVALSNVAMIVGSILSVALAGLWVIEQIPFPTNVEILPATNWDLRWNDSLSDDRGAGLMLVNIELGGSDVPDGIWKDLVFPDLNILTLSNGLNSSASNHAESEFPSMLSNFIFNIPALRPELTCEATHSDNITVELILDNTVNISAVHSLPAGCHGGPRGDRSYAVIEIWPTLIPSDSYSQTPEPALIGQMMDMHMRPLGDYSTKVRENHHLSPPDNPDGCPSIAIIVASFTSYNIANDNITVLGCSQKMRKAQTQVALGLGNAGRISRSSLLSDPVVDESTAEYLTNGTELTRSATA
ncbi:hypothetical protein F5B21DRAFT_147922 [Xylaria acuta]|nr:hypothetical protein F5B21DRAFT_147922 [Xylaria acuta]